jgi:hypothetical protein
MIGTRSPVLESLVRASWLPRRWTALKRAVGIADRPAHFRTHVIRSRGVGRTSRWGIGTVHALALGRHGLRMRLRVSLQN